MSFALEIKKEVLSQEFAVAQAHAFVSGLISTSSVEKDSKIIIKFNNHEISTIINNMLDQLNIKHSFSPENKNWIVLEDFKWTDEIKQPSYFFAGAFVGGGSISDTHSTSYHLEIQMYSHENSLKMQNFLNKYSFKFTLIPRRKLFVLYLKKSDQISDFLRAIKAFNSLMSFEDARISRDHYNQLNRYSNLDTYNQKKLASASSRFKKDYEFMKKNNLYDQFREPELLFFELKNRNPYSSLEALVKLYKKKTGIQKTRAGLNHWLIKLRLKTKR